MKQTTVVVGCVLVLVLIAAGWREFHFRNLLLASSLRETQLLEEVTELEGQIEDLSGDLVTCEENQRQLAIEIETLSDRAANLVAQRDHLRAECDRQTQLGVEHKLAREQIDKDLQAARQELLEQTSLPRELEGKLAIARSRNEELEQIIDRQSAEDAHFPHLLKVEGISQDGLAFGLSGSDLPGDTLPLPVLLCRRNEVVLDGWIHRIEKGTLVGHVSNWRMPSSALVKGEKVFILSSRNNDPDP